MRAVDRKNAVYFQSSAKGRPLQLAPRSTTDHDRVPQKSRASVWSSQSFLVGGRLVQASLPDLSSGDDNGVKPIRVIRNPLKRLPDTPLPTPQARGAALAKSASPPRSGIDRGPCAPLTCLTHACPSTPHSPDWVFPGVAERPDAW